MIRMGLNSLNLHCSDGAMARPKPDVGSRSDLPLFPGCIPSLNGSHGFPEASSHPEAGIRSRHLW